MNEITPATLWAACRGGLSESFAAVPASSSAARRSVASMAVQAGATPEQVDAIRLATSEAVTNAIVHAYGRGAGEVHVGAFVASGELWVLVGDDGEGPHPLARESQPGLGLTVISHACDEVTMGSRPTGGTELRMCFHVGADEALAPSRPAASDHGLLSPA